MLSTCGDYHQMKNLLIWRLKFGRVAQVARATALQAVGHRFKSCPAYLGDCRATKSHSIVRLKYGLVAQLV